MSFTADYAIKNNSAPLLLSLTLKEYFFFLLLFCLVWLFFNFVSQALMKASLFNRRHAEGYARKERGFTEHLSKYFSTASTTLIKNCMFYIWIF